jgi:hypothetical protein
MATNLSPDGHRWGERELKLQGNSFVHRHCLWCSRDFVMRRGSAQWDAVHVGIFAFSRLEDDVNHRWLSEPCPRRELPEDRNELRALKFERSPNQTRRFEFGTAKQPST